MVNLKRKLLALTMLISVAATGAFAQKDRDRRPPKGNNQVVVTPKGGERPPSNNNNRGGDKPKGDKKGKP
jgi:hypothetical protein